MEVAKSNNRKKVEKIYGDLMRKRALGEMPEMGQVKQLRKLMKKIYRPGMSVVDVGCGSGHFYPSMARLDKNIRYHGIDVVPRYIRDARRLFSGNKNVSFSTGSVTAIPLPDKSCDIALCYMVIEHMDDYRQAIKELMRITRGHLYMRLFLSDHTYIIKRYKWKKEKTFSYYNIFDQAEVTEFLKEHGARKVEIFEDDFRLNIPKRNEWDTYTMGRHQVSGCIIMPWRVVHASI